MSLGALEGSDCSLDGRSGRVKVTTAATGDISLRCVPLPQPPPPAPVACTADEYEALITAFQAAVESEQAACLPPGQRTIAGQTVRWCQTATCGGGGRGCSVNAQGSTVAFDPATRRLTMRVKASTRLAVQSALGSCPMPATIEGAIIEGTVVERLAGDVRRLALEDIRVTPGDLELNSQGCGWLALGAEFAETLPAAFFSGGLESVISEVTYVCGTVPP